MKALFVFFLTMLLTSACSSSLQVSTPTPYPTRTLTPSPAPTSTITIMPTSTEVRLPYNLVQESSEYCSRSPYAVLSIGDAEGLSEDEIARNLVGIWLERYKNPEAHPYCRIDDYRIDDVYYAPHDPLPLEPKGAFSRIVMFAVKLIQVPNDWMAFPGEIDEENWLNTGHRISIAKGDDEYTMFFVYP